MKREYTAVYREVEDGWIMATVPELPGAVTQGKDLAEARSMIKEAVELLLSGSRRRSAFHLLQPHQWPMRSVPRHREIKETVARTICDQLGISRP